MDFTPANELERLLVAAATDPAARPGFYRAILEQELFVITEGDVPEREREFVAQSGTPFQVRMIELDGVLHAPVFTSAQRTSAVVPHQVGFLAINGRALLTALRGKPLVMNPGSAYGKMFTPTEVESTLNESIFAAQDLSDLGGSQVLLGQPNDYPQHIVDALRRFFARRREVNAAYLAHAFIADDVAEPHTLIGVEMAGDWRTVVAEAGLVVREVAKPGEIVDFAQVSPGATDVIGHYMQNATRPFYRRRKWLGLF